MDPISILMITGTVCIVYFVVTAVGSRSRTILHGAVAQDDYEKVIQLIEQGKDVNAVSPKHRSFGGWTPLHQAKSVTIARILIDAGANVNALSDHGWTPLYYKCKSYNGIGFELDVIDFLLDNGARRGLSRTEDDPMVIESTLGASNRAGLMEKLLKNESDGLGRTSLHIAAGLGDIQKVRQFISEGNDINARDMEGITPLLMALLENKVEVAEILLDHGPDVNIPDKDGTMPLSAAAGVGNKVLVKTMISKGSKINCQEKDGWSPLHYACHLGHSGIVKILLEHGADPSIKDVKGLTPADYAEGQGYEAIRALFE